MLFRDTVQRYDLIESQHPPSLLPQSLGNENLSFIPRRNEASVERRVEMRSQQEAIEDVEAFGIVLAVGPRFNMARPEQLGHRQLGNGLATVPISNNPRPKISWPTR